MDWTIHRTVTEEPEATASIEALERQYERFSDQWEGFKWHVCRSPYTLCIRTTHNGKPYWLSHRKGHASSGLPDIAVVYSFDDDEVVVIDVKAWDNFRDEA